MQMNVLVIFDYRYFHNMKTIFIYKKTNLLSSSNSGQFLCELTNIRGRRFHFQIKTRVCRNGNCLAGLHNAPFGPRRLDLNFSDGYREVFLALGIKSIRSRQNDTGRKCSILTLKPQALSLIHISEPTRQLMSSRMPSSA